MTSRTHSPAEPASDDQMASRVMRKVALRLIPFLGLAYFLNYIDRTNIAFAKLTMSEDLGLTETAYGLASGLFFVGYILLEVPSNLALHKFGARRWIARILVSWGLIAALMAFVPNATWLNIARVALGIAEAGFFPGIMLYLTFWFPRAVRVRLVGVFMVALPLSSALGAPISSAIIQYWHGLFGLEGWRVMFLVEGIPTVLLGIAAWFYLTDRPRQAKWLSTEERTWLDRRMETEHSETADTGHVSARSSLRNPNVWLLGVTYFGIGYGLFAISFFLPTIVAGFAKQFDTTFSIAQNGLIVAVPFLISSVAMILWSRRSDRLKERMWHVIVPTALATVSVPVAMYMSSPLMTMVVITLTAVGIFSALPVFWYLPTTFLTGAGAAAGIALVNTIGASAGLVAPYMTGWLLDATGSSKTGLWVVGGFMAMAVVLLLVLRGRLAASPVRANV
ncbi:MFS transporter [Rhodococcus sp. BP-252]|uniref:MFS transporter n=1 Tax=Rhodococcoides kyotonense TaxID=398843 RepID=A0A177Y8S5_9NOCA|nr:MULTISPECIES: MFS transporter [Rhodococcus]MBY6411831.1 MFS transporter [Rhodococcus sp. BP-320]MBY6416541.1 MFS transporter [Rhodococcus sp. BP-321]MBY6420653.1 MFS transporter [Rhodococcus sp. BP-324]MBY6426565.1 MFS transporter [Rhodococcus sp. BP-323]MBY6431564.1 MFS transporter [Rhodococcus sp. BP-322]